jgi:hypothetical protein
MAKKRKLLDTYRFPGFRPEQSVIGIFGDPKARIIPLIRKEKKRHAEPAGWFIPIFTTGRSEEFGTCLAAIPASIWIWKFVECIAAGAGK